MRNTFIYAILSILTLHGTAQAMTEKKFPHQSFEAFWDTHFTDYSLEKRGSSFTFVRDLGVKIDSSQFDLKGVKPLSYTWVSDVIQHLRENAQESGWQTLTSQEVGVMRIPNQGSDTFRMKSFGVKSEKIKFDAKIHGAILVHKKETEVLVIHIHNSINQDNECLGHLGYSTTSIPTSVFTADGLQSKSTKQIDAKQGGQSGEPQVKTLNEFIQDLNSGNENLQEAAIKAMADSKNPYAVEPLFTFVVSELNKTKSKRPTKYTYNDERNKSDFLNGVTVVISRHTQHQNGPLVASTALLEIQYLNMIASKQRKYGYPKICLELLLERNGCDVYQADPNGPETFYRVDLRRPVWEQIETAPDIRIDVSEGFFATQHRSQTEIGYFCKYTVHIPYHSVSKNLI